MTVGSALDDVHRQLVFDCLTMHISQIPNHDLERWNHKCLAQGGALMGSGYSGWSNIYKIGAALSGNGHFPKAKLEMVIIAVYLVCVAVLFPNRVLSHSQGLHGISGDVPTGEPSLPAISGAFEVEMNVLFNGFPNVNGGNPYASLFHFHNVDETTGVWFGHQNRRGFAPPRTYLEVKANGSTRSCTVYGYEMVLGVFYNFKFSLNAGGVAEILLDGVSIASRTGFTVPTATTTVQDLGLSQKYDPNQIKATEPHAGVISGVRITNAASPPQQHPRERFKYLNFPGQVLAGGFVASFYARFDDLSRSDQNVFDFGNDGPDVNIFCGQKSSSSALRCGVYQGGSEYSLSLPNALVVGEYAFYHFSVSATGEASLQKDTGTPAISSLGIVPTAVFRRNLSFGVSNWIAGQDMDGVVLGFRLDPTQTS